MFLFGFASVVLGVAIFVVRFNQHHLETPWYVPILATIGVASMSMSAWQRRGILRTLGVLFFGLLCGMEWFMLLHATKTPTYAGPIRKGHKFPEFNATLADGKPFGNRDLESDRPTVMVFFRGHW